MAVKYSYWVGEMSWLKTQSVRGNQGWCSGKIQWPRGRAEALLPASKAGSGIAPATGATQLLYGPRGPAAPRPAALEQG